MARPPSHCAGVLRWSPEPGRTGPAPRPLGASSSARPGTATRRLGLIAAGGVSGSV